jgi:hypothetical protein
MSTRHRFSGDVAEVDREFGEHRAGKLLRSAAGPLTLELVHGGHAARRGADDGNAGPFVV